MAIDQPMPDELRQRLETETSQSGWQVEVLTPVAGLEPSKTDPDRPWMITEFKLQKPDGTTEEIPSTQTLLALKNPNGTVIEVPAFAVHHINSLHLKGDEAGSQLAADSLESALSLVAKHLPAELPFAGKAAAFAIELDQPTGTEGVTTQAEMLEKGVVTQSDLDILAQAKQEVFVLNLSDATDEEKQRYVDRINQASGLINRNVKLGLRGGAIVPFFTTERQPTTKMFIVVGKEADDDGSLHNRVWTMAPGRHMEKLPTDNAYRGKLPTDGVAEGLMVAHILQKQQEGQTLSAAEVQLVADQKKAQECWWEGGFIVSPPKA